MEFETKFNIGDIGWYMSNNRVVSQKITGFNISVDESMNVDINYSLHYDDYEVSENDLFPSKEELLKSL